MFRGIRSDSGCDWQLWGKVTECDSPFCAIENSRECIDCWIASGRILYNIVVCYRSLCNTIALWMFTYCSIRVSYRYLINDACVLLAKPLVSGSAVGLEGQVTVFAPRVGPCYRWARTDPVPVQRCQYTRRLEAMWGPKHIYLRRVWNTTLLPQSRHFSSVCPFTHLLHPLPLSFALPQVPLSEHFSLRGVPELC